MKIRFVAFGSVRHQRELGDAEDLASDVLDVRLPHRTIRIENADVEYFVGQCFDIRKRVIYPVPIPTKTISPRDMLEITFPSTDTEADATR